MKIIRNHQHCSRLFHVLRIILFDGHQLVNGIINRFLNPCSGIQIVLAYDFVYLLVHSVRPVVPVTHRFSENLILLIKQYKVYAPGVNPHTFRDFSDFMAFFHSGYNLVKKPLHVPVKNAVFLVHAVPEAVHFLQLYFSVLKTSQYMPPAGRADINCKKIFFHCPHLPFPCRWRRTNLF